MYPIKYEAVDSSDAEVSEHDATDSSNMNYEIEESPGYKGLPMRRQKVLLWLNGLIFCISLYLLFVTVILTQRNNDGRNNLLRMTSEYCMRAVRSPLDESFPNHNSSNIRSD